MAEFPCLPLFTDAYLGDTRHLSTIEHGAYLLLLMTAWRSPGCRLPDDDRLLARYAGLNNQQWKRIKPIVLAFFTAEDGWWKQRRLSDEYEVVQRVRERQIMAGRASARVRSLKTNGRHSTTVPTDLPTKTQRPSNEAPTPSPSPLESVDNDQSEELTSHARASPPPDDRSLVRLVDIEFIGEQARILAGLPKLSANDEIQLRFWFGDGIAPETILETIRAVMANTDDHTSTLRRFDKPIRKEHAKTLAGPAKANGGGAKYVSGSGYVYRGQPEQVMREAEKRADWTTYYQAKRDAEVG